MSNRDKLPTPEDCFNEYRQYYIKVFNSVCLILAILVTGYMIIEATSFIGKCKKALDASGCNDRMFFSGVLVSSVALFIILATDRDPMKVLRHLHRTSVISLCASQWDEIRRYLRRVNLSAWVGCTGILFIVAMVVVRPNLDDELEKLPFIAAYALTGARFGRIVSNGIVGLILRKNGVVLHVDTSNRDGAGGLAVVGNFYIIQVSVLLIPLCWITYWLIDMFWTGEYQHWFAIFIVLIGVVLVTGVVGLIIPLCKFREMMLDWKRKNSIYEVIARKMWQNRRDFHVRALATIPDWPISSETLRTALLGTTLPIVLTAMAFVGNS